MLEATATKQEGIWGRRHPALGAQEAVRSGPCGPKCADGFSQMFRRWWDWDKRSFRLWPHRNNLPSTNACCCFECLANVACSKMEPFVGCSGAQLDVLRKTLVCFALVTFSTGTTRLYLRQIARLRGRHAGETREVAALGSELLPTTTNRIPRNRNINMVNV